MSGPVSERDRAALVALVSLPGIGPYRLDALVDHTGSPAAAFDAVLAGDLDGIDLRRTRDRDQLVRGWRTGARQRTPEEVLRAHVDAGVQVLLPSDAGWPPSLLDDPEPPRVLFARGDIALLHQPGVAVVGTRRCTAAGAQVSRSLGAELTAAGIGVVSGLALGIDGAAHCGALDAGGAPVGVVGSGLDVVYPPRHRSLWAQVADAGVLVSEAPLGGRPERWRFPARNRLIAALSLAVVVVESRARGGSMSTVAEAQRRQVEVLAVPGPVLAEQSAGTNRLLSEGALIARDVDDVLCAIGAHLPVRPRRPAPDDAGACGGVAGDVAAVLSPVAVGVEQVAAAAGVTVPEAITALARLEASGVARRVPGGYERAAVR